MKRATWFGIILTLSLTAVGQDSPNSPQSKKQQSAGSAPSAATRQQVRGCIMGGERGYVLLQSTGMTFELQGDPILFDSCRGRLVEVTANQGAPTTDAQNLPQLRVSKLRILSDKCPMEAANPASQLPQGAPGSRNQPNQTLPAKPQ